MNSKNDPDKSQQIERPVPDLPDEHKPVTTEFIVNGSDIDSVETRIIT